MDNIKQKIGCFDRIKIITTRNVNYVSAPPETEITPNGIWSVMAIIGQELLCTKQNVIIKIPIADVLKVFDYDVSKVTKKFGKLSYDEEYKKH